MHCISIRSIKTLLAALVLITCASARTWTDTQGRTIEAEILRVEGDKVIVTSQNKELSLKLSNLSPTDQKYVEAYQGSNVPGVPKPTAKILLGDRELKPDGEITSIETTLSVSGKNAFSKALKKYPPFRNLPQNLSIHFALPSGFNPAIPQRVVWISVNPHIVHEQHLEAVSMFIKGATDAGFVVIIADADKDIPEGPGSGGTLALHACTAAVNWSAFQFIANAWKGFDKWKFICCGSGLGSGECEVWSGFLVAEKVEVMGIFLDSASFPQIELLSMTGGEKADLKKIKVYLTRVHATQAMVNDPKAKEEEAKYEAIWKERYGDVKVNYWHPPHPFDPQAYSEALAWIVNPP